MIYLYCSTLLVATVVVHQANAQYLDWPQQQYNNFNSFQNPPYQQQYQQQQQQFQQQQNYYNQFPQQFQQPQGPPQYQPPQYQPPQYQPYQQGVQQIQQQQQLPQLPQQQPSPPIYSQTVVIPQAPNPPIEAYQAQQYIPPSQPQQRVEAANIPRYHQNPPPPPSLPQQPQPQTDLAFQHVDRARSVQSFDLDNKLFREQPNTFNQNQEKIELLAQPPPPPAPPAVTQTPLIRVPPPPARFVPTLRALYNIDSAPEKNPQYKPDEIIVDGHHTAYFEDTQRTKPQGPKTRVVGGNVHSSSASVPQKVQGPQHVPHNAAVISNVPQQAFLKPDFHQQQIQQQRTLVRPQQQARPVPRPVSATRNSQQRVRPQGPSPTPAAQIKHQPQTPVQPVRSHLVPKTADVSSATPKPKTIGEKFLQCCRSRKVAQPCERICSFEVLSKKTLTGMFLGTDPCPQSHGLDLMQCAADNDDHTECCLEKEVDRTSAGRKCLGFCNMKPGITFQADVSMLPCWSVLNDIKQCFKENLERQLVA